MKKKFRKPAPYKNREQDNHSFKKKRLEKEVGELLEQEIKEVKRNQN